MSPDPTPQFRSLQSERRLSHRYPVCMEVEYRLLRAQWGNSGRTLNMSSSGICFSTSERLLPGELVEVAVDWPILLDGVCPLKLVITGRVVRSDETQAVIIRERHQFHTRRRFGKAVPENVDRCA